MERLVRFFFELILRFRLLVALGLALATAWFAFECRDLRIDFSVEQYFPHNDPDKEFYDRYKEIFPDEDTVGFVLVEGELFQPKSLKTLDRITRKLEGLLDIVESVTSLTNVQTVRSLDGILDTGGKLLANFGLPPDQMEKVRKEILGDPLLADRLISKDGRIAVIRVGLRLDRNTEEGREAFVTSLHQAMAEFQDKGFRITVTGLPVVRAEIVRMLEKDQQLFGLVFLLVVILLGLCFRSVADVSVSVGVILLSVVWTLGMMAYMGYPVTFLSTVTPIIIMIVGISDAIHVIGCYRDLIPRTSNAEEALLQTFQEMSSACLLTSVTTAIGFLALLAMNIEVAGQFGLATAFGVMAAYVLNMLFLPVVYSFLPAPKQKVAMLAPTTGDVARFLSTTVFWIEKRQIPILVGFATFALVCGISASKLEALSLMYGDLKESTDLYKRNQYVDERFGGTLPLTILFEATGEDDEVVLRPETLRAMKHLAESLEREPEIGDAASIVELVEKANAVLHDEEPGSRAIPDSAALIMSEIQLLDRSLYADLLSSDYRAAQVRARITDCGSKKMAEILRRLRQEIAKIQIPGLSVAATGTTVFVQRVFDEVVYSLVGSLGLALILILGVLAALLRNWRLVTVAMIANALPVLFVFAALWWTGNSLKPETVLLASIVLGLAVDDTIHVVARLRIERQRSQNLPDALRATLSRTGLAAVMTTAILSGGYISLCLASFYGLHDMGVMISSALLVALVCDLILLPACLLVLEKKPTKNLP